MIGVGEHGSIPHLLDHRSIFPPQENVVALVKAVKTWVDPCALDKLRIISDGCIETVHGKQRP